MAVAVAVPGPVPAVAVPDDDDAGQEQCPPQGILVGYSIKVL